jgi:predicted nucleic acid-binding Zn ribbon protein
MKKLISQSTFHLKGTGWYVTDYARKPGSNKEKGDKSHKKATETKGAKSPTEKSKKESASAGGKKSEG